MSVQPVKVYYYLMKREDESEESEPGKLREKTFNSIEVYVIYILFGVFIFCVSVPIGFVIFSFPMCFFFVLPFLFVYYVSGYLLVLRDI